VQKGAFGACLTAEPQLVADCVKAIRDEVSLPVTVKHRVGLDQADSYEFVRDFVGAVSEAGCRTFIVHARNAVLKGLSPKKNREVPPLKYDYVYRLKRDFPHHEIVINGGITTMEDISRHLQSVDGAMLGRAAYHDPWVLADGSKSRADVVRAMKKYCEGIENLSLRSVVRHMLGLYHGTRRARLWRRRLSDPALLEGNDPQMLVETLEDVEGRSSIMMAA
jgi:tRNA-dihydrouridine synthase A